VAGTAATWRNIWSLATSALERKRTGDRDGEGRREREGVCRLRCPSSAFPRAWRPGPRRWLELLGRAGCPGRGRWLPLGQRLEAWAAEAQIEMIKKMKATFYTATQNRRKLSIFSNWRQTGYELCYELHVELQPEPDQFKANQGTPQSPIKFQATQETRPGQGAGTRSAPRREAGGPRPVWYLAGNCS
jgi:hypothetical protein